MEGSAQALDCLDMSTNRCVHPGMEQSLLLRSRNMYLINGDGPEDRRAYCGAVKNCIGKEHVEMDSTRGSNDLYF